MDGRRLPALMTRQGARLGRRFTGLSLSPRVGRFRATIRRRRSRGSEGRIWSAVTLAAVASFGTFGPVFGN